MDSTTLFIYWDAKDIRRVPYAIHEMPTACETVVIPLNEKRAAALQVVRLPQYRLYRGGTEILSFVGLQTPLQICELVEKALTK